MTKDQYSLKAAKQGVVLNVLSNLLLIALNVVIGVVLASFLVKELGVAAYGMIGLANSFHPYLRLFTSAISNSVIRYVAIAATNSRHEDANAYFNTAIVSMATICVLLLVPTLLITVTLPLALELPKGMELQCQILIGLTLTSGLLATFASIFRVPFHVCHRFAALNSVFALSRAFSFLLLIAMFYLFGPALSFVGIYQILFQALCFISILFLSTKVDSFLIVCRNKFCLSAVKKLAGMSVWVVVNDVSVLLYLAVGFIIVNKTLGVESTGLFSSVMLLNSFIVMYSGSMSSVLNPIMLAYVAKGDNTETRFRLRQAIRAISFFVGIPVVVICGVAKPLMIMWLGPEFGSLMPLTNMVLIATWGGASMMPASHLYRAKNRLAVPGLVNLGCGCFHVFLTLFLILYYGLNLSAFGISFAICFGLRGVLFNAIYAGNLVQEPFFNLAKPVVLNAIAGFIAIYVSNAVGLIERVSSWQTLGLASFTIAAIYICIIVPLYPRQDIKLFLTAIYALKNRIASK